jgi:hypothetical protein
MDSIIATNEILTKTQSSIFPTERINRMIILNNDPIILIRDIEKILDYIEAYN